MNRPPPRFGLGRGRVFPAERAQSLVHPLRRLVQNPERTVRATGIQAGDRVLELGCGPGFFAPALRRAAGPGLVVHCDLQEEMLQVGRHRQPEGRWVQGDALALPYAGASFDVVFAATVLGEWPDLGAGLAEVRRVLAAEGRLGISETRRDSDFFSRGRLRAVVEPHGFRLLGTSGPAWQYVAIFGPG